MIYYGFIIKSVVTILNDMVDYRFWTWLVKLWNEQELNKDKYVHN